MRLRIEHQTTFTYEEPISEAYTEMRLKPSDAGGQTCLSFSLHTEPRGSVMQYTDRYGNDVRHFDVLPQHKRMSVVAVSEVLTPTELLDYAGTLEPLDLFDYLTPTRYAPHTRDIQAFAAQHVVQGNPFATAMNLMRAIFYSMKYEPGTTDVRTSSQEALSLQTRGVPGLCASHAVAMPELQHPCPICKRLSVRAELHGRQRSQPCLGGCVHRRQRLGVTRPDTQQPPDGALCAHWHWP